jgi:hypothetical protein
MRGVFPLARGFLLVVLAAAPLRADDSLTHARRAQALLGKDVWSEVIRVENSRRFSHYPRTLHALVFEFDGILWLYADADGTQSISLQRGRLAEEKADFGPLLRDIEPGFVRWSVVPDDAGATALAHGELPNGCFIESVAALRQRLAQGEPVGRARLLSYYGDTPSGRRGHTVLTWEAAGHLEVFDPEWPGKTQSFPAALAGDALGLARTLEGGIVTKAHWVPVDLPATKRPLYAAAGPVHGFGPGALAKALLR